MITKIPSGKKIYFLSDFHLGAPNYAASLEREKKIVRFLDEIADTAAAIFIVGDIFDFWFEYKRAVPKYYTRLLGKLASLTDNNIPVYVFSGNHDMWMSGYFEEELNIPVFHDPREYIWNDKKFLIGHGDGLGPHDHGYKFLKKIFRNPICRWLFGVLHPNWGIGIANYFSRKSREKTGTADEAFLGEDKEWLILYCKEVLTQKEYDYFIFGHRHYPIDFALNNKSRYINLGDWIRNFTYASFDGEVVELKKYE
ncbi:MAG: UDP-2,3-diacylglucosamine diphosphatase [Chitinophagaceae bacterium]|nr:UDP-2,3-diacylglucosamine diphosphatase [Chitinophagaceae bacterium]